MTTQDQRKEQTEEPTGASHDPQGAATSSQVHAGTDAGRRDRKKHATRQALRRTALRLVAERGIANVTIEDITEAADVSMRTFFNYFPSKESAVIGADPERIEQVRMSLVARPADESPLEALRSVTLAYTAAIDEEIDDLDEGREAWFRRLCAVRSDPELLGAYAAHMSELEQILAGALAERLGIDLRRDPYPALVTATVIAATRVAALYWSANDGVGSLTALTDAAIDNLANGLHDDRSFVLASADVTPPVSDFSTSDNTTHESEDR